MIFKRKIYDKLVEWKNESDGRTALLLEGARRVGKSTLVENFAKNEYKSYILIDFSNTTQEVKELFEDTFNLNYIFLQLQYIYDVILYERKSVIIFDEVQLCPKARQAIKSLVKDGRYDYIETGSLISIRKNVKDILIPSEERKLNMYPMDYEEFLWATGNTTAIPILKQLFDEKTGVGDKLNRTMMRDFRLYMLVGGMPQAVEEYIKSNNFRLVDTVKREILNLYEEDFRKIDTSGNISMIFNAIPVQLHKNGSRFQVNSALNGRRISEYDKLSMIAELIDSKTVLATYHVNDPNVGLSGFKDLSRFKLYLADTGLFVTLAFRDKEFTENDIYKKLLNDKLSVNLGYVYENAVAQILTASGNNLYYYSFYDQSAHRSYEIDFLVSRKNKICPIEVKSSNYTKHTSLDMFYQKYSSRISQRYLIGIKDLSKDQDILCVPIYMAQFI